MNILVTGATGQLGTAVIDTLLRTIAPQQIYVLTRNEEKRRAFEEKGFPAFLGSYDDVGALEKAMQHVDTVLLISSGDQGDRMQEHKNVVDSAVRSGVTHLAYTGRCLQNRDTLANKLMMEHFATEDYIIASGLTYTFFRNALYMDAIPQFIGGPAALENGINLPAGDGKVAFALRRELGEAMANVLTADHHAKSVYNFTGSEVYSFDDVAAVLSDLSGRAVRYNAVEDHQFTEMMSKRNLPPAVIKKILDFITDIRQNQEAGVYTDLEVALGRKAATLQDGLKEIFAF